MEKKKYPNQKSIRIGAKVPISNGTSYQRIPTEILPTICNLSQWGLKVWLYLNKNKEDFEINLSPQAVLNFYEIKTDSRTSVRRGIEELFDKGYLVEEEDCLTFFQIPRDNFTK